MEGGMGSPVRRVLNTDNTGDEEPASLQLFQEILKEWEDGKAGSGFDPTELLHRLSNLLEKETNVYMARDPDPFEERHPTRVDPHCQLGLILKAYFKKETLVQEVFQQYMRENHFTSRGIGKSSSALNVAACRLVLDIMPGLETAVLNETEGLVSQLYKWVEEGVDPLASYAIGLLAVAMELNEVATDAEIRDRNSKLVPEMLVRLKGLQEKAEMVRESSRSDRFKRPFALFSKSPLKNPRRLSQDGDHQSDHHSSGDQIPGDHPPLGHGDTDGKSESSRAAKRRSSESEGGKCVRNLAPGWPTSSPFSSPPRAGFINTDNSNSSWAEMELNVIGHFEIYPISLQASQIFILRLLTPLAEYQDFLPLTQGTGLLNLLENYISVRHTGDARLAFEALRLLASLFCHKKFTLEWVSSGGLELLMHMPRPSMAATGSSLCLYYLACDDDTMEKICSLPQATLQQLVRYCLWLLECSHDTGRQYAIMFFGLAFPFRNILEIFDTCDGLRKLYNSISTLGIIRDRGEEREALSDDQEFMQRQHVRYTAQTLKRYMEAHLAIRVGEEINRDLEGMGDSPQPPHPTCKPYRLDQDQVTEHIESLVQLMDFRGRWDPIDRFIKLGGVQLMLQVIALSYDWTFNGRAETVKCVFDVLSVCSVVPRVQLALCEKFDLPDEANAVGMNVILGSAEGEIVPDSPDVQRAALLLLTHLLCGPVIRPGCAKHPNTPTPSKKRGNVKTSDEVINKVWECVRFNNGIMALLQLIQTKTPISDADSIRLLACKALVGLARSSTATQIMSKLPIFNNGTLNQLLREPVLQDRRSEHVKFQQHAHELIEKVSGPMSRKNYENNDITLDMLHRASVVASTKIRYNPKQLWSLIHEHMVLSGLPKTAEMLRTEKDFVPLVPDSLPGPPVYPHTGLVSFHPSHLSSRRVALGGTQPSPAPSRTPQRPIPTIANGSRTPARPSAAAAPSTPRSSTTPSSSQPPPVRGVTHQASPRTANTQPAGNQPAGRQQTSALPAAGSQLPIRVTRPNRSVSTAPITPASVATPGMKSLNQPDPRTVAELDGEDERKPQVSLCSIISDFLAGQHALCRNPMSICPEFDLFLPHKCPDQRAKRAAPLNLTTRLASRSLGFSRGGLDAPRLDRKLLYSRFRPVKTFRSEADEGDESNPQFTSCAFSGDCSQLFAGTYLGDVKVFNMNTGEETSYSCHDSYVYHVQPSRDCRSLITSSSWRTPYSKLHSLGEWGARETYTFKEEEYLEFSPLSQDKLIGTRLDGVATVYDMTTGQQVRLLKPDTSNAYTRNRATFDPCDELILCDGVLWDYRAPSQIHKFDKLNQTLSGVFHPNGLEIISNTEVWDIRTFHLLRTVPQLDQCQVVFNTSGEVIFGVNLEQELEDETKFETAFKTFDASDYSLISTVDTRKSVLGLCPSKDDLMLAVVEQSTAEIEESVVRLYDVGRLRAEEEEDQEDQEDQDEDDMEESEDDDGSDDPNQDQDGEEDGDEDGDGEDDDWGLPIALFPDGEDLSASGSGTPSEDDEAEGGDDDASNGSWEDIDEEDV